MSSFSCYYIPSQVYCTWMIWFVFVFSLLILFLNFVFMFDQLISHFETLCRLAASGTRCHGVITLGQSRDFYTIFRIRHGDDTYRPLFSNTATLLAWNVSGLPEKIMTLVKSGKKIMRLDEAFFHMELWMLTLPSKYLEWHFPSRWLITFVFLFLFPLDFCFFPTLHRLFSFDVLFMTVHDTPVYTSYLM